MPRIYVSHSSDDSWVATQVANQLHSKGIETFLVQKDVGLGNSFDNGVQEALRESDAVIFLVTPRSIRSEWMLQEIGAAWALKKHVIPILYNVGISELPNQLTSYLTYQLDDLDKLVEQLRKQLATGTKPKFAKAEQKSLEPRIFMSYAQEDRKWLDRIRTHLRVLQHDGLRFEIWDDTRIRPGSKWKDEIADALKASSIGILIVSTDFLASDFVVSNELPELLLKAKEDGLFILPLIVRPCRYLKHKSLSVLQAVNDPNQPLIALEDYRQEEILVKLADVVEERVAHLS